MKSNWAILDVTQGRKKLRRRLEKGECVTVVITGTISGKPWGNDDGTSQGFAVDVHDVVETVR